jgi:hypothetical protein
MLSVLLFLALAQTAPRIEIVGDEVWLDRGGESRQLTHDGHMKGEARLSPSGDHVAYYEICTDAQPCVPEVVVLDLDGNRITHFQVRPRIWPDDNEPCGSLWNLTWIRKGDHLAVSCHFNPSVSIYTEIDVATAKNVKSMLGLWFTPSPEGSKVAYVDAIVHFAPPWAQTYFLKIDDNVVYPLPRGGQPSEEGAYKVRDAGLRHFGIHRFSPDLVWSPAGKRIAFIDCIFDWLESEDQDADGYGNSTNERYYLVAASPGGPLARFPVTKEWSEAKLQWTSEKELRFELPDQPPRVFRLP